jgi:hypothetical protein
MKRILCLCVSYALLFSANYTLTAAEKPRVAVMPFQAGMGVSQPEANYLADRVRTGLIETGIFEVISNDQLDQMLKTKQTKQEVGAGSCTSEKCVIDLGNALECEKMIVGTAAGAFEEFTISIKLLDVVKQKYELAKEISLKSKNEFPDAARKIVKMIAEAKSPELTQKEPVKPVPEKKPDESVTMTTTGLTNIGYGGMLWRSLLLPGWGHVSSNQSRGYLYGSLWAGIGGAFLWSHLNYTQKNDEYLGAQSDFDSKFDSKNNAFKLRGYFSFAFLGVYLFTISDMAFSGKTYASTNRNTASTGLQMNMLFGSENVSTGSRTIREDRMDLIMRWGF